MTDYAEKRDFQRLPIDCSLSFNGAFFDNSGTAICGAWAQAIRLSPSRRVGEQLTQYESEGPQGLL